MAPQCDVVIVVGSPNSSNSNRLREVARNLGRDAYLVDSADELEARVGRGQEARRRHRRRVGARGAGARGDPAPAGAGRAPRARAGRHRRARHVPAAARDQRFDVGPVSSAPLGGTKSQLHPLHALHGAARSAPPARTASPGSAPPAEARKASRHGRLPARPRGPRARARRYTRRAERRRSSRCPCRRGGYCRRCRAAAWPRGRAPAPGSSATASIATQRSRPRPRKPPPPRLPRCAAAGLTKRKRPAEAGRQRSSTTVSSASSRVHDALAGEARSSGELGLPNTGCLSSDVVTVVTTRPSGSR